MNTKEKIQRALKAERGLRLSAAEVQGLASALGVGFPKKKPRRRKSPSQEPLAGEVRWMIRRDMPDVLAMDAETTLEPWSEERYLAVLKTRNMIGVVAEQPTKGRRRAPVVGAMVYSLYHQRIVIERIFVKPSLRLQSFGRQLIESLQAKLDRSRRRCLQVTVNESDLNTQLFLQACGFSSEESQDGRIVMRFYHGDDPRPFGQTSERDSEARKG